MKHAWIALIVASCGGDNLVPIDAARHDPPIDGARSGSDAAPADAAPMVRVFGHLDFGGPVQGAIVQTLGDAPQTTSTGSDGDFYFDAPQGSRLVVEALPTVASNLFPMIRGVVAEDHIRPRIFYLMGPPDVAAADGLGKSFDPAKAIVETDFRNAAIGGYGATLTRASAAVSPDFGIVYDADGNAVLGTQTVAGGDGSTLLLAGLSPGSASFAPVVPAAATLPCHADDADPLPLVAGAVTWVDFECGSGTD